MKKVIALFVVSIGCVFSTNAQVAPPMISVSGTGEVKVPPDEVYLRVGVETRREDLVSAKRDNDQAVSKALAFLKKEVPTHNVQTDFISFEPIYDRGPERINPSAYIARNQIEIKMTNITAFEHVLTGLMTNGVNAVQGIEFRTSELRKHRDAARAMAVKAAIEKADAIAKELGVQRGKVYNVSASDGYYSGGGGWGPRYNFASNMSQNAMRAGGGGGGDEGGDTTLSAGLISISATVSVSFLVK